MHELWICGDSNSLGVWDLMDKHIPPPSGWAYRFVGQFGTGSNFGITRVVESVKDFGPPAAAVINWTTIDAVALYQLAQSNPPPSPGPLTIEGSAYLNWTMAKYLSDHGTRTWLVRAPGCLEVAYPGTTPGDLAVYAAANDNIRAIAQAFSAWPDRLNWHQDNTDPTRYSDQLHISDAAKVSCACEVINALRAAELWPPA